MVRVSKDQREVWQNVAILKAVVKYGLPVRVMAQALQMTRTSVYRRMSKGRVAMCLAKERARQDSGRQEGDREEVVP